MESEKIEPAAQRTAGNHPSHRGAGTRNTVAPNPSSSLTALFPDVFAVSRNGSDVRPNPATAFLSSYLLLYPGYYLTDRVLIDASLFKAVAKPGYYRLSAHIPRMGSRIVRSSGMKQEYW
jgi:hypothetical protein